MANYYHHHHHPYYYVWYNKSNNNFRYILFLLSFIFTCHIFGDITQRWNLWIIA